MSYWNKSLYRDRLTARTNSMLTDLSNEMDKLSAAGTAFRALRYQSKSKSPSISVICGIAEKYQIIIDGFITAADYDAVDCRKLLGYISEEPEDLIFGELYGNWEVAKQNRDNEESAKNKYISDNTYTKTSWEMISGVLTEVTTNVTPDRWVVDGYNQRIQNYQDEMDAWQAKLNRLGEFEDRSGALFVNSAEFRANAINALSELNACLSSDGSFKDNSDSSALDNLAKLHAQRQEEYYNQWLDENGNPDMDAIEAFLSQNPDSITLDQRLAFSDFERDFFGKVDSSNDELYAFSDSDEEIYGKDSQLEELESRKEAFQDILKQISDPNERNYYLAQIAELDRSIKNINNRKHLNELYERKEAYQQVLNQISDPNQRDYYLGLIAQLDKSINNIDKPQTTPLDDKIFIETTYTSQKLADLYEEKEALEKVIEMDPSQRAYLQGRIAMLESNINTWVDYGIDNADHEEEFRFAYDQMKMSGYTEEEILKVVSYWMHVDGKDNLQGKEMPPWWEREYLTIPDDLKLNEDDVVECFYGSEKSDALFKHYEKTYLICDAISGRGNQVLGNVPMTSEEIRNEYLSGYRSELYFSWLDYVYGGMYDYVEGIGTARASKYGLENHMDFTNQKSEYGVYQVYDNVENDYYKFCKNAYLYKYDHAEEFYNHVLNEDGVTTDLKDYLLTSDNDDERLIYYIKKDIENSAKTDFTYAERNMIEKNYEAYVNGELVYSKNIYDMACLLQNDQSIFALGACEVSVDGLKVKVDATLMESEGYLSTHNDSYVMDFSDCCTYAFGSYYISNEDFIQKSMEFSAYRYDNGWTDPAVKEERIEAVDEILQKQAEAYGISLEGLDEDAMNELRRDAMIMADSEGLIYTAYLPERKSAIEDFNDKWDETMLCLGVACSLLAFLTPGGAVEVMAFALGAAEGGKKLVQGNYSEAALEIGITVLGSGMALYDKLDEIKDAKNLSKYISEATENVDDAERLLQNVDDADILLKNVDDEERYYRWLAESDAGINNHHPGIDESEFNKWMLADQKVAEIEALGKVDGDELLELRKIESENAEILLQNVDDKERYYRWLAESDAGLNNHHPGMDETEFNKWMLADQKVAEIEALGKVDGDELLELRKIESEKYAEFIGNSESKNIKPNKLQKEIIESITDPNTQLLNEKNIKDFTRKGNFGEMVVDVDLEGTGHIKRISVQRVESLDAPMHHGIDGVFENTTPPPKYFIVDSKYLGTDKATNSAVAPKMSVTKNHGTQLDNKWIVDNIENQFKDSDGFISEENMNKIQEIIAGINKDDKDVCLRLGAKVDNRGNVTYYKFGTDGKVINREMIVGGNKVNVPDIWEK